MTQAAPILICNAVPPGLDSSHLTLLFSWSRASPPSPKLKNQKPAKALWRMVSGGVQETDLAPGGS